MAFTSDIKWSQLINFIGGINNYAYKLSEKGNSHWKNSSGLVTEKFGFSALPSGIRYKEYHITLFEYCSFWTLT